MGENTKIEWVDHTVNLWHGCTKVHSGCNSCYAETLSHRWGNDVWGNDKPRKYIKSAFNLLAKLQRSAHERGVVETVFVGSMMDIFEKPMPLIDSKGRSMKENTGDIRKLFFSNIYWNYYPNLMFLLLTKRPSNINKIIFHTWQRVPPKNVMFGCSPVDQPTYNNFLYHLSNVRGRTFMSIEPQLADIDLYGIDLHQMKLPNWIIQGGESGHHKRPFNIDWAYRMRDQCQELEIPYFFKQVDKVKPIPKDLQTREFPVWMS